MELKCLEESFTVCKLVSTDQVDLSRKFLFLGKTDEEISLVCRTVDTPAVTVEREDGWKGFRVQGVLDFSLVGILAKISGVLADNGISIFALSTYNTDYILVREKDFADALGALSAAGYKIA